MTRRLFDSTTAADIPAGSELVGGYVDGSSAWSAADWLRFPGRTLVRYCIFNNRLDADVIDIEPGNNDAAGAVPFVAGKWARGETPTVYCFSDAGPAGYRISDVRAACDAAGVRRPLFIVAEWDNDPSTFDPAGDPEIVGKQYANPTLTGAHYDASVVADFWPGVDREKKMVTRDDYIAVDPATGLSLEDLVKATTRVVFAVELQPALEKEIAAARVAAAGTALDEALAIVSRAFISAAGSLLPPPPAGHADWQYFGESADGSTVFYVDAQGARHNVTDGVVVL